MKQEKLDKLLKKKIFSIEGNIGAGKTTIIQMLKNMYNNAILVEEPVEQWTNISGNNLLKKKIEDIPRWGYSFESYVLVTKMNELIKSADSEKDIILIERCMLTDKAFFDVNVENGLTTPMEEAMFNHFYDFLNNFVYPKLCGIIYISTPSQKCVERIKKRARKGESTISIDYLNQLNDAFIKVINDSKIETIYINGEYDLERDCEAITNQLKEFIAKCLEKHKL